jgi:NADPH-dependent 2,4-dienoyl-CoA reductase/sulfur reductase-like enzyme
VVAGQATVDAITNPNKMFEDAGIHLIIDRATRVDSVNKRVSLADNPDIEYDKLILACGSSPVVPPIPGSDLKGVFTLRTAPDAELLGQYLKDKKPSRIAFVGAGFINLEVAALLSEMSERPISMTVIELLEHPLPLMLDREMGKHLEDYLEKKGLQMRTAQKVTGLHADNGAATAVELENGERIETDMVFISVGTRPNLELARDMGLEIGQHGVKINNSLETSNPDVLACGDIVEVQHFITRKAVPSLLRGPAVIMGRLAAKRLAGYDIKFPGVLNNSAVRLFDKYIGTTGLNEDQAKQEGFDTIAVTVTSRSKHGMIPGVQPWLLKLVFDRRSQKLLGGQILSDSVAPVKEIDTVNALILGMKTIPELTTLMCAGNPDCSSEPSLEPITIAAEQALQKLR